MNARILRLVALSLVFAQPALADPPVVSYVFPAGGRRGTTVDVRVGGLNLLSKATLEMLGPGVEASSEVRRIETVWFEGPLLPLPDSQQAEDYPKDYGGRVAIAADAAVGPRPWRLWTSQGASGSLPFVVGDLPEVVESESDGDPVPAPVTLPVTINGRIFPREDVDLWTFPLTAGQVVTAVVDAGRLGSPLDPWLEALDDEGRRLGDPAPGASSDARLAFVAPRDGTYTVKIHDVNVKGGQAYVYRLTLTTGPSIARVFPLGGRRGALVNFIGEGPGVGSVAEPISLSHEGAGRGPERMVVRFDAGGLAVVEVDDLPGMSEAEPNDDPSHASALDIPAIGDGRIAREGDVDFWALSLDQGRSYDLDLRAARLGSRLDGVLILSDANGKPLARAEGVAARGGDAALTFAPPASGRYLVRVADRFRSRGGPAWGYRLRVAEAHAADFRLTLAADTLTLPRGGTTKLKVEAERLGGFAGPIELDVEGLPEGASSAKLVIGPKAATADLAFKADAGAPIRSTRLTIRGRAEIDGTRVVRVAARRAAPGLPDVDTVRLAVALPPPFAIAGPADFGWSPRGSVHHRRYQIARNTFNGPIEVRLADRQARHLQGVTGPVLSLAPGADAFDYPVTLPPWMEIGRTSRAVVMASGVVNEPDGTAHEVCFSTPKTEVQAVAVIGPGMLGLEARRTSLSVAAGETVEVPIKVSRGRAITAPVHIDLIAAEGVRGITAEPLVLDAGQDEAVVRIVCRPSIEGPPTAQVVLRATSNAGGDPVTAEATLTIVAGPSPGL